MSLYFQSITLNSRPTAHKNIIQMANTTGNKLKTNFTLTDARQGITNAIAYLETNVDVVDIAETYVPILKEMLFKLDGFCEDVADENDIEDLGLEDDLYYEGPYKSVDKCDVTTTDDDKILFEILIAPAGISEEGQDDAIADKCLPIPKPLITEHTEHADIKAVANDIPPCKTEAVKLEPVVADDTKFHKPCSSSDQLNKSLKCPTCEKVFPSATKLQCHELRHAESVRYSCVMCEKVFLRKGDCMQHLKSHKEDEITKIISINNIPEFDTNVAKSFRCSTCGKDLVSASKLRSHQLTQHATCFKYKCSICDRMFSNKATCKQHMQDHKEKNMEDKQNETNKCLICTKTFVSESKLQIHQKVHAERVCSVCQKIFNTNSTLVQHMKIHALEVGQKPYTCSVCNKGFAQIGNLRVHERIHSGDKPYCCEKCDKRFKGSGELRKHTVSMHDASLGKTLNCTFCEKTFHLLYNLKTHMRIHTGERPYVCEICGKTFRTPTTYYPHIKIHTGEKLFPCTICSKPFISQSGRKRHMRSHTGERPYVCPICGKTFSQANSLQAHMRTHTGEKPYACTMCDKRCADGSNLKSHMKTHGINRDSASQ